MGNNKFPDKQKQTTMMKQTFAMLVVGGSVAYARFYMADMEGAGAPRQLSDTKCNYLRNTEFVAVIDEEMGVDAIEEYELNCWAQVVNGMNYWFEIRTDTYVSEYSYIEIYKPIGHEGVVTCFA